MKKVISAIIIAMICLLSCTQVFAASTTGEIRLDCSDSVKAGETLTVKICAKGLKKVINGIQGKITYDSNILEYVTKKSEKDTWTITGYNSNTGIFLAEVINVLEVEDYDLDETEPIISFTFRVKEDTTASSFDITVSDIVVSPTTVPIENKTIDKEITIIKDTDTNQKPNENPPEEGENPKEDDPPKENEDENNQQPGKDDTGSKEDLPYAGIETGIIFLFAIVMVILVRSYLGYSKYRDII